MNAPDRLAADITRGSIWPARSGAGHARVLTVSSGYVRFARPDGTVEVLHHLRFRERFASPYDTRQFRSQFSMSLANLVSMHVFYSRAMNRVFMRSTSVPPPACAESARGRPALPADAVHVGTYSDKEIARRQWHRPGLTAAEAFFQDLNDVVAEHFHTSTTA